MVARKTISRKALFAAALKQADMSASEFASTVGKVSRTQLYRVLDNPVNSAPLTAEIDRFIARHIGKREAAFTSSAA